LVPIFTDSITRNRVPKKEEEINLLEPQELPILYQGHNSISQGQINVNFQDNDFNSENTEVSNVLKQDYEAVDEDDDGEQFNFQKQEDEYKKQ
jgi:hypothetical protein